VQHSIDGRQWENLHTMGDAPTTNGPSNYEYLHSQPCNNTNFYRIKSLERSGETTYSPTQKVVFSKKSSLMVLSNPMFNKTLNLLLSNAGTIELFNQQGSLLLKNIFPSGRQTIFLNTLSSGIYLLRFNGEWTKVLLP